MKTKLLTAFTVLLIASSTIKAQENPYKKWEYQAYPDLPFLIEHIEMDLHLQPEISLIRGAGRFEITSRQPNVTQLVFSTSDLEIQEISVQGKELDFMVQGDSLIIQLADTLKTGEGLNLLIMWESSSHYGIHKDQFGNMWTSLNPGARHHWIPIPDHPEVTATITANFTLPAEMDVVFNGKIIGDEVISTEEKTVQWSSKVEIPVTGMTLATGNFEKESARSGIKEVAVYAPGNLMETDARSELLTLAVQELKTIENTFNFEFPFEALSVVILPDHYWEEIQAGAGVIYLYQNLGSLSTQLKRGIVAQWFGNYHQYLNELDSRYELLKASAISSETISLKNADSLQSINHWNHWTEGIGSLENQFMLKSIQDSWNGLIQHFEGVTGWNDYASFWYDKTGAYWQDIPMPEAETPKNEEHLYTVTYEYDEMSNHLLLLFEAQNNPVETLVGIEATAFGFFDTTRSNFSVTGQLDTVDVDIPDGVEYLILTPEDLQNVKLVEYKPSMFLIRQLNSSNPEVKKQAAIQLRNNLDNPDLQLALNDALKDEQNPAVRAEISQTLAMITDGATGTEQTFLKMLNAESNEVQLAGLRALVNYPDNDQVMYAVQTKLLQTEVDSIFDVALSTYGKIAELDSRLSIISRLEQMEEKSRLTLKAVQAVAGEDTAGLAIQTADQFVTGEYPSEIRKQALQILIEHQHNAEYWVDKLEVLEEDPDPRIRFQALKALKYLPEEERISLIEYRLKEEMDPRVRSVLQKK
jgi:HEAT repeat protein